MSLLLLVSQQMATSHAMTHWAGSRHAATQATDTDSGISSAFAQDQSCHQCLAFAQLAGAVAGPSRTFHAAVGAVCARPASAPQPACSRTTCVFESRAPPSFA